MILTEIICSAKNKGFTLAEVLITLGIIGIIAAMTLPTLIQKQQEKVFVVKLQKAYSILTQAFSMATMDNSTPVDWIDGSAPNSKQSANNLAFYLKKQLKISKDCSNINTSCFNNGEAYTIDGKHWSYANTLKNISSSFVTTDGYAINIQTESSDCSTPTVDGKPSCAQMYVDINGTLKPNTIGKDIFLFYIAEKSIYPAGTQNEIDYRNPFHKSCLNKNGGAGCTAWVIFNGNMQYLHCNDLSWNGKQTCK